MLTQASLVGAESQNLVIQLDSRYFCGRSVFLLRPYRSLTDEELALQLFAMGATADDADYAPL